MLRETLERFHSKKKHDELLQSLLPHYSYMLGQWLTILSIGTCLKPSQITSPNYKRTHEGDFRFDELVDYLKSYKAPMIVSIGEDASMLISRIEYDKDTDRLVGFVLPSNESGTINSNRFMAVSFQTIEEAFQTGRKSKYTFVYTVQPLVEGIPSFAQLV